MAATATKPQAKTRHFITGKEYPLKEIFSKNFEFTIPNYQRPYSWTTEQARELYDDILSCRSEKDGEADYFLGSIVLIKEEDQPQAEVIDGQQRLTTLTIMLAAIAERLEGKQRLSILKYLSEPGDEAEDLEPRPRLTLRLKDREFFLKHVQADGGLRTLRDTAAKLTDPQRNMRANAAYYHGKFATLAPAVLFDFAKYVVNHCFLVVVSTPNQASAFRVFSVLNNRGLDLSPTDILKSEIIGAIAEDKLDEDTYTKKWEENEDELGRDGFRELFSHIRMIYLKAKPQNTLVEDFKKCVLTEMEPSTFIDKELDSLADAYLTVTKAAYESKDETAAKINSSLNWLLRIDNVDWIPPAILLVRKGTANGHPLVDVFDKLDRLAGSMFVRRCDVNTRIERYAKVIDWVRKGKDLLAVDSPLALTGEEQKKTLGSLDGNVYEFVGQVRTYILLRLDSWLGEGAATYDHKVISVEHVLPQTVSAGSKWESDWPKVEDRTNWVHRLGNLVLLSRRKNSEAQNSEFDVKKSKYFGGPKGVSSFRLTTQVLNTPAWTPLVVKTRQRALLRLFADKWSLPLPAETAAPTPGSGQATPVGSAECRQEIAIGKELCRA